jgi:hypothetical protein
MPFKSKQQSKACFATGGFGGKVDCEEWAHKTNYKKLPRKKFKEWLEEVHPEFNEYNSEDEKAKIEYANKKWPLKQMEPSRVRIAMDEV